MTVVLEACAVVPRKKERRHLPTFWLSKRSVHPDIPIDLMSNIDIIYAMNTHHM